MKNKLTTALTIITLFISAVRANAQELEVAQGEYVVRLNKVAALNGIAKKHLLLNVSAAASTQTQANRKLVKYDKEQVKKDCALLAKRYAFTVCEPNARLKIFSPTNDTLYSLVSDALTQANVQGAWDITTGSKDVIVAVTDTGIDYKHIDLKANMWSNPAEIANDSIDNDGNGIVDDVYGANFAADNGDPMDDNGHGTHCAGTIGASGNNSRGIVGVNWKVSLMALKFLDHEGGGYLSDAVEAIEYVVAQKQLGQNIAVINASWGGGGYLETLKQAIADAGALGILFVAAAGNESNNNDRSPSYPADYDLDNIISVGAVDSDDTLAEFSNYGVLSVDLAAPGVNILSTTPGNQYEYLSGTSMATPHVAGAVALLAAANPSLSIAQIKSILLSSSRPANIKAANGILDLTTAISLINSTPNQVSITLDKERYATPANFIATLINTGSNDSTVSLSLNIRGLVTDCQLGEFVVAAGNSANISARFQKLEKNSLATFNLIDSNGLALDQSSARVNKGSSNSKAKKQAKKLKGTAICSRIVASMLVN